MTLDDRKPYEGRCESLSFFVGAELVPWSHGISCPFASIIIKEFFSQLPPPSKKENFTRFFFRSAFVDLTRVPRSSSFRRLFSEVRRIIFVGYSWSVEFEEMASKKVSTRVAGPDSWQLTSKGQHCVTSFRQNLWLL